MHLQRTKWQESKDVVNYSLYDFKELLLYREQPHRYLVNGHKSQNLGFGPSS